MSRTIATLSLSLLALAVACAPDDPMAPDLDPSRHGPPGPPITVMTRNMYIGADVDRVIAALAGMSGEDPQTALQAVLQEFVSTDLPARLNALAAEIAAERPHAVGLQEVSTLDVAVPGLPPISADFLAGLQQALALRGLAYHVVSNLNFNFSLFGGAIGLQDRDVLLVDASLPLLDQASGTFSCPPLCIPVPNLGNLTRGWVRAETKIAGRHLTIVSTHPESGDNPLIAGLRAGQMIELMATLGANGGPVILLGDLNDVPGSPLHQVLQGAGFVDVWASLRPGEAGYTCCHATDLRSGAFTKRIDYVMVRGGFLNDAGQVVGGGRVKVIGESPAEMVPGAFGAIWPSDHGGVVASLPPAR